MNLAVHGLEGDIRQAITYYEDPRQLVGKADYVMANPPFNVDEIDADKVRSDPRLPFGLPGVNKKRQGFQRQLYLDQLLLQLPERTRARRLRHVLASFQRRRRRSRSAAAVGRDRPRGRDDRHPRQLLLQPHRALRVMVPQSRQARSRTATKC